MIRRNEIPILEYDDSSPEVLAPDHGLGGAEASGKVSFCLSG